MQYQRRNRAFQIELRHLVAVTLAALLLPISISPAFAEDSAEVAEPQQQSMQVMADPQSDEPPASDVVNDIGEPESNSDPGETVAGDGAGDAGTNLGGEVPGDEIPVEPTQEGELSEDSGISETTDGGESSEQGESGAENEADGVDEPESETPKSKQAREVAPLAVGTTKYVITKVGDRTVDGKTSATPLSGVTFSAYAATSSSSTPPTGGTALGSCTTDVTGKCAIELPNNYSNGVWFKETAWPAGWQPIQYIGTGAYNSSKNATAYMFRAAQGSGSGTTTKNLPEDSNAPSTQKSGVWVNARNNPGFPQKCGVSIAMVFDTSASISSSEMTAFKNAANSFVGTQGLGGTPSTATLFRFDTTAQTMNGGVPFNLAVAGSANANTGYLGATKAINSLPNSGNSSGYTNWDAALQVVKSAGSYDMVLFMTDGDPTAYGLSGADRNTTVQFLMLEQAVMSANALKVHPSPSGLGTKIVGVGVGMSTNSHFNLQAITGPTPGQDYFLSDSFDTLESTLQEIATKNCGGTLNVVKQIKNSSGEIIDSSAADWSFTATGGVIAGGSATQTTTTSGTSFAMTFPTSANATVEVAETPQAGYTFDSASCTNAAGQFTQLETGFAVEVNSTKITTCIITNKEQPQPVNVSASKVWVVTDSAGETLRTAHIPAATGDDELPPGLSANLFINKTGVTPATSRTWGDTVTGYMQGESVTISETSAVDTASSPGCQLVSQEVTSVNGSTLENPAALPYTGVLAAGGLTVVITNTVQCATSLTLLKYVEGGDANPSGWDLVATSQVAGGSGPHQVPGAATADDSNTFEVVAGDEYLLTEQLSATNTSIAHLLDRVEKCTMTDGTCIWNVIDPEAEVTVALGAHDTYRFVNVPIPLLVVPLSGGFGTDWFIIAGALTMIFASIAATFVARRSRRLTY